jgi:purine-nucleoside phosphorylase
VPTRLERAVTIHLRPSAPLAERVLLPGDPQRALAMAQALLESPQMFNTRRGLWGYTGGGPDGHPVTIQATGMGGPSAAIVVEELIDLGAQVLIRTGTCGALRDGYELGELVTVERVLVADGAGRALAAGDRLEPDAPLMRALEGAGGGPSVTAISVDLFYDPRADARERMREAGADVVEMEAAAVLATAQRRGVRAACLLLVSDLLAGDVRRRIGAAELEAAERRLGEVALGALRSR